MSYIKYLRWIGISIIVYVLIMIMVVLKKHSLHTVIVRNAMNSSMTPTHRTVTVYGDQDLEKYQTYFVPSERQQFSLDYQFELSGHNICDKPPYLMILILTVHDHLSQREAIRKTWGSVAKDKPWLGQTVLPYRVRIAFLLAHHDNELMNDVVKDENERTGDIILTGQREDYSNLTLKVLMGFKWVQEYCNSSTFVMKVDEDQFVVVPAILEKLKVGMENKILGALAFSEKVIRKGKYYLPESAYPLPIYPPHVKGNIYAMSRNLTSKILSIATYFKFNRIEDVFITGILAYVFDVRHVSLPSEEYNRFKPSEPCEFVTGKCVTSLKVFGVEQYNIWNHLLHPDLCIKLTTPHGYSTSNKGA